MIKVRKIGTAPKRAKRATLTSRQAAELAAGRAKIARFIVQESFKEPGLLLAVREATHGNFADTALHAQRFKLVMHAAPNFYALRPELRESLEMMATKMARILSGNADHADHWDDIGGFARLGRNSANMAKVQVGPAAAGEG